jgi:hypothetical protein
MASRLDTLLRRSAGIFYAEVRDEGVMLNVDTGRYHSLNDVGSRIWELLEAPQTPAQLRDRLLEEFDVDAQECETAVLDFVGKLLDRGVIQAEPELSPSERQTPA